MIKLKSLLNEGRRLDYINQQIAVLEKELAMLETRPNDYRENEVNLELAKWRREKANWEGIYAAVNENDITAPKKVIVYHGTSEKFKRFNMMKSTMGHVWFSSSKERILRGEAGASGKGFIVTAEVTFQKPAGWAEYERMGTAELKRDGFDGAILPDDDYFDCVVFSQNQIKVLKIEEI